MKILKMILNILGIFLATIFSTITFSALLLFPLVSTISSGLQPENIQKLIFNINFSKQLLSGLEASAPPELKNLDANFIDELMDSALISDIIQLYMDNLLELLENDSVETIDQPQIQQLLDKHSPELVSMVRRYLPSDLPVTDEEITKYTFATLEPALLTMVSSLPSLKDLGISDIVITLLHMLYNKTILKQTRNTIILCTLCIFICRFPKFKGFLWLGITYLNSTIVLFLCLRFLSPFMSTLLPHEFFNDLSFIIQPLEDFLKLHISKSIRTFGIIGIIFLVVFIISRAILSHKKNDYQHELAA